MIDRVGGVTVDVHDGDQRPDLRRLDDPRQDRLPALGGQAHPRRRDGAGLRPQSRKGDGNSDFARARRQQQLLVALQKKLVDPAMLPNLPGILKDATKTIKTNFPPDQLSAMMDLARRTDGRVDQARRPGTADLFDPPDEHHQRLHPGPEHGQHRQAVDQHLRSGQPVLHGPGLEGRSAARRAVSGPPGSASRGSSGP